MSKREPRLLLDDVRVACGKIGRYLAGLDQAAFLADEKTVDAVVRNVEIVGEAVKQLPAEFKERHPDIPWRQIAGLRNRIVHDYAGVDLEIVWHISQKALPDFLMQIRELE
jgi:uncharacterized protein with HEPN domain